MSNLSEEHQKFLLETAIALDRKLTGKPFREVSTLQKIFQCFANLFGYLLGFLLLRIPPARISNQVTSRIAREQAKNKIAPFLIDPSIKLSSTLKIPLHPPFEKGESHQRRASQLILISHPETVGSGSYLLGNLIFRAVEINRLLFPNSKFKFVQAIDPFALDTLSPFLEATYAGFMATGHIAMDRQPTKRTFFQKCFFSKYRYTKTIFHILRELKSGSTVCLALSGGVIHNSRIFYLLREFAQRIHPHPLPLPLRERVSEGQVRGIYEISSNKLLEKQLISILTQDEHSAVVTGKLSENERNQLSDLFAQWEVPDERIHELEEELSLSVPYRFRLFHILFKKLVAKGTPLLILPIAHTDDEKIVLNKPVLITGYEESKVKWISSETLEEKMQEEKEFVKDFVNLSFNRQSSTFQEEFLL